VVNISCLASFCLVFSMDIFHLEQPVRQIPDVIDFPESPFFSLM